MAALEGACHCGAVSVRFETETSPTSLGTRICQCRYCRRSGMVAVSDPAGRLVFSCAETDLSRYRFGLGITDFLFCSRCGVVVGAVGDIDGSLFGVLNARTLHDFGSLGTPEPMDYEGEDVALRTARRRDKWTPAELWI